MRAANKLKFLCALAGLASIASVSVAATITVTGNGDSGAGTLRQAIADASSGDTINFDATLNGSTITLTSDQLIVQKSLHIAGPGPELLTIDGGGSFRVFCFVSNLVTSVTHTNVLSGLTITGGTATNGGGGIRSYTAWNSGPIRLTLSNCVVRGNTATAPSSYSGGGGISLPRNTYLTMVDCEVVENVDSSSQGGGGVWCYYPATFQSVSFVSNTTTLSGGAICFRSGYKGTIINCTFSGNASTYGNWSTMIGGGAIYMQENGVVEIYNSTIAGNSANKRAGGVFAYGVSSMILTSTIVADNTDTEGYPDIKGTFTGVTNSLIEVPNDVSLPGADNITGQDPKLLPLANNGGVTRTHALDAGSPAIDKGANHLSLTFDQRGTGYLRLVGEAVDIGSYEYSDDAGTFYLIAGLFGRWQEREVSLIERLLLQGYGVDLL